LLVTFLKRPGIAVMLISTNVPHVAAFPNVVSDATVGNVKRLHDKFLQFKVLLVEIASTVSFLMLLLWFLLKEYRGLFE
jgi:hypothetical protein